MPDAAYVVLATGLCTVVSTILTQAFIAYSESKKIKHEKEKEARISENAWKLKQNEIKSSKLADLWQAVELARDITLDEYFKYSEGKEILPPPSNDMARNSTSIAYGISLLYFPEIRPIVYKIHVGTVEAEAAIFFHRTGELDETVERLNAARTELTEAIEITALNLQKYPRPS